MNAMGNVYQRTSKIFRLCTHWTKFFRIAPSRRAIRDGETVAFCRVRREGTKGPEYRSGRGAALPLPQAALRTLRPGRAELFTVGAARAQAAQAAPGAKPPQASPNHSKRRRACPSRLIRVGYVHDC